MINDLLAGLGILIDYMLIAMFSATIIVLIAGLRVSKNHRAWRTTLDYMSLVTGVLLLLKTIYMALKQVIHG